MSKKKHKDKAQPTTAETKVTTADGTPVSTSVRNVTFRFSTSPLMSGLLAFSGHAVMPEDKAKLTDAVAAQVEALTADFDGTGGEELPSPPKDLTTYRDAWASAAAKCDHQDAIEIMYGREWLCESCHRMLNREDMRKAGWSRWG